MAQPEADSLPSEQKARLQEVADLMLEIYQTLAEMQYIQPEGIIRGPHDISSMRNEYEKHKLDPAIIYLYSILPYIDKHLADNGDFFQGGAFFNHMDPLDVERSRDPCYASPKTGFDVEEGEYMHPWYTPLSNCGNHSSILILDVKEWRVWVVDQIQRHTTDPFFVPSWYRTPKKGEEQVEEEGSNWGESDGESWSGEDEKYGSEGSSELWDDEDEGAEEELEGLKADQAEEVEFDEGFEVVEEMSDWERRQALNLKNQNSLELVRFRDAGDVLRDINRWYRELKELPGQGEYTSSEWIRNPEDLRPLYLKNGWPDNFDGEAFQIDLARKNAAARAHRTAMQPLDQLREHESWDKYADRFAVKFEQQIEEAKTPDEEWLARFELWKQKERNARNEVDVREAREKAEKMCPGGQCQREEDLPLWEFEQLRVETQTRRERLRRDQNWRDAYGDDRKSIRYLETSHGHDVRKASVSEKAYEASKADAERLCPGRTFEQATGIKSLGRPDKQSEIERTKYWIEYSTNYLRELREFEAKVKKNAMEARKAVENEVKREESNIEKMKQELAKKEECLKERGKTG